MSVFKLGSASGTHVCEFKGFGILLEIIDLVELYIADAIGYPVRNETQVEYLLMTYQIGGDQNRDWKTR